MPPKPIQIMDPPTAPTQVPAYIEDYWANVVRPIMQQVPESIMKKIVREK